MANSKRRLDDISQGFSRLETAFYLIARVFCLATMKCLRLRKKWVIIQGLRVMLHVGMER